MSDNPPICQPCITGNSHDYTQHTFCQGCGCLHSNFRFKHPETLYHGGIGGLDVGDRILPASVTGYLRPQRCLSETGYQDANTLRVWHKASYRPDRVYATRGLAKAKSHAKATAAWVKATGANAVFPAYGAVYRVESYDIHPDFYHDGSNPVIHSDNDPEAFYFASEFRITEVTIPKVEPGVSVGTVNPLTGNVRTWQQTCKAAYSIWRESTGYDWWV